MVFEVALHDRLRIVSVEPVPDTDGQFRVGIDNKIMLFDARRVGASTLSLIRLDVGGSCHDIELVESEHTDELLVQTRGCLIRTVVNGNKLRSSSNKLGSGLSGEQRVVAPMPGKVIRVLVTEGDEVKAKQGLVVIEAMKMENELTASKDGHVKEINVEEGVSVEVGRLLIVVE